MTDLHARCPHCRHDFVISEAVCAMAAGKVRCGYCQTVFHAPSHATEDPADQGAETPTELPPADTALPNPPVELTSGHPRRRPGLRIVALSMLAVLLLLGLAGSYAWNKRDTLQQHPHIRPLLTRLCRHLPCEMPVHADLQALQTDALVVTSHPDAADTLQIRFTFRNSADFVQPFPVVELTFLDDRQRQVAVRRFAPPDYLPEGLHQLTRMPVDTPVDGAMSIPDPGESAVNYRLRYHPAGTDTD